MKLKILALAAMANLMMLTSPIVSAIVITPKSVVASSTFINSDADNLINSVGMDNQLHNTDFDNMWLSNQSITATLTFDLGSVYDLSGAYVWQYNPDNATTTSGVKQFNILTSLDGLDFVPVFSATLAQGSGVAGWFEPEFKAFSQTAQYVQFSILSNYGSSYSGLSEVKFETGVSVPEPQVMGLLALSLLGLLALRAKTGFSQRSMALPF
ncbi:discoidin domain-containing protein [Crenothrix sp.]|uniref:discoidin domain-containing protein n=1 Tax=Crenothrix sp. TaxID=3100433 RepID=UPI00374D25E3